MARRTIILVLLPSVLILGWSLWKIKSPSPEPAPTERPTGTEAAPEQTPVDIHELSQAEQIEFLELSIQACLRSLQSSKSKAATQAALEDLKTLLFSLPPEVAVEAILDCLEDTEFNASTRLLFTVGRNGMLKTPSSLRVALMNWLGQIDNFAAGILAERILNAHTDPDEWAVSLRNYAWANPGAKSYAFLREKVTQLINDPEWSVQPTAGYLEAFDVIVFTRFSGAAPMLSELLRDPEATHPATQNAAFLSLDRLFIQQPKQMLEAWEADSIQPRGEMVAQMYARADARDPQMRAHLTEYILSPTRTVEELESFADVFPNQNYMISDNLLSITEIPNQTEIRARDEAAYAMILGYLNDERFAHRRTWLETIKNRLEIFLGY